jgi:hypothetical protein
MFKKGGVKLLLAIPITVAMVLGVGAFPSFAPATAGQEKPFDHLKLYEQDYLGKINSDGAQGNLKFILSGPNFEFQFGGEGLNRNTPYSLIRSREPGITLPYRFDVIGEGTSDSSGRLNFSDSYPFNMTLISAQMLLIPTEAIGPQQPDGAFSLLPLTSFPKCLFGHGSISYTYTGTTVPLIGGSDWRPQPINWEEFGPKANDVAIDFTLMGIDPSQPLATGNTAQALTRYKLSELWAAKPVVLVFGAYT